MYLYVSYKEKNSKHLNYYLRKRIMNNVYYSTIHRTTYLW